MQEYAIELERENGEWRINNISTNSELEELVEDAPDVQMLFEDESTPVSDPDIERAHQQAALNNILLLHFLNVVVLIITMYFDEVPYFGKIKKCIF